MRRTAIGLGCNERGTTLVEFAFVAPVLCLLLVGAFDIAHSLYLTAVLQGVVQKTSRDSALESGASVAAGQAIDNKVTAQITELVNPSKPIEFKRRFYRTFSLAQQAQAETWTEVNGDGTCDNGESYQDNNGNGIWDADGGDANQGGAKDKTVYTVTVTYKHLLPIWKYIGGSDTAVVTAQTVLANQPYGDQGSYSTTIATRTCT